MRHELRTAEFLRAERTQLVFRIGEAARHAFDALRYPQLATEAKGSEVLLHTVCRSLIKVVKLARQNRPDGINVDGRQRIGLKGWSCPNGFLLPDCGERALGVSDIVINVLMLR
jgi:hypothetical protein